MIHEDKNIKDAGMTSSDNEWKRKVTSGSKVQKAKISFAKKPERDIEDLVTESQTSGSICKSKRKSAYKRKAGKRNQ